MKRVIRLMVILLTGSLLVACATSPKSQSSPQAPVSQEIVRGEARTRAKAHTDLGFEYYAQNQFGFALKEAEVALKDDSSYTPAYNLKALVYTSLGDNQAAEAAFQRAMQISPGDPEIANNYGWFLCQTKREQQSFSYFNEALKNTLYPTPVRALGNAAECALRIHDYAAAETYLKRALGLDPNSARALYMMATTKYKQKQFGEAHNFIEQLHRNSEPNAGSALLAYRIARDLGDRDDEARYLSLLRKKFSGSEEYRNLLQGAAE